MTPNQKKNIAAFMIQSAMKKKKKLPFGPVKGGPSNIQTSHPMATKKGK